MVVYVLLYWGIHEIFGPLEFSEFFYLATIVSFGVLFTSIYDYYKIIIMFFNTWILLGNANFELHYLIWDVEGNLELVNDLNAVFIGAIVVLAFLFGRSKELHPQSLVMDRLDPEQIDKYFKVAKVLVLIHLALTIPNLALNVSENYGDFSEGLGLKIPFYGRLTFIYPIFLILGYLKYRLGSLSKLYFGGTLILVILISGLTGTRFNIVIMLTALLFVHNMLSRDTKQKVLSVSTVLLSAGFVFIYLAIPILRSESEGSQSNEYSVPLLAIMKFGGEYRDAAWSTNVLSEYSKELISDEYLETVFFPAIPRPLIEAVGLDYTIVFDHTSSFLMADSLGLDVSGIRIGGIMELYYWKGLGGVIFGAIVMFIMMQICIRYMVNYRTSFHLILPAITLVIPVYFAISQSNLLLVPLVSTAIVSLMVVLISNFSFRKQQISIKGGSIPSSIE